MKNLKKHMKKYAAELFDLYWNNAAVFDKLPRKDMNVILDDYDNIILCLNVNDCPCPLCMTSYLER